MAIKNAIGNIEYARKHNEYRKTYCMNLIKEQEDLFSEDDW